MWQFLKRSQKEKQSEIADQRRRPLTFSEIVAGISDFSDFSNHDVALKFWLPEAAEQALGEIAERSDLSVSEFLRQFFAVHCYGLYAFYQMTDAMPRLFKEHRILFSKSEETVSLGKKRIDTYWVPELGKNIAPVKVWVPKRIKSDLQILSEHVGLTVSNYVREIVISRLLGHGMLPQRPMMFNAHPTPVADDWCEDREVPWREVSEDEFHCSDVVIIKTEWVDPPKL